MEVKARREMVQVLLRRCTRVIGLANLAIASLAVLVGLALAYLLLFGSQENRTGADVPFAVLERSGESLSFKNAFDQLRLRQTAVQEVATKRAEQPFWLLTDLLETDGNQAIAVELPSRHVTRLSYWVFDGNDELLWWGSLTNNEGDAILHRVRSGHAVELPLLVKSARVLFKAEAVGPARLTLARWHPLDLQKADRDFHRSGGVLFGSLLMIAAFTGLISLLARDVTFFIFAAWVVSSLRVAAFAGGWDTKWLGFPEWSAHVVLVRHLPLAAYAFLTVALFRAIFSHDIARLRLGGVIRALYGISGLLLVAAVVLPHRLFIPTLWSAITPSLAVLIWLTIKIYRSTRSPAAIWYASSWIATHGGLLGEVAFAVGLLSSKPTFLNGIAGAISAALLSGIALAERMRQDRTARIAAQEKSVSVLKRFRETYNAMPVGLFGATRSGTITLFNPAFAEIFGLCVDAPEAAGSMDTLLGADAVKRLRDAATVGNGEVELELRTGSTTRWFLARVREQDGALEGSLQDITSRKLAETQLRRLVDHDPLTNLLNHRGLDKALERIVSGVKDGLHSALVMVDLDRFKVVNDLYGHATGDALLQAVGARLQRTVRPSDAVARIGDSFVVVFCDCPNTATEPLTERLREVISERPFEIDGKGLNITVSIGVVSIDSTMTAVDAMAAADRACGEAKARGRNCVVRLNEQDAALRNHLEELKVVADLQQLQSDRYFLEFQPIVSMRAAMSSLSYEVLIRMRGENGAVIPPGRFIGAAERNGLMSQIDRWVLRSTLEWLETHPEHRDRLSYATINLSGASLNDSRFVADAFAMIADFPQSTAKLCFEITEGVALQDVGSTRRFVDRIRTYGSKLALDDFGAGYTSFNYLKEIPADYIKIDGSFVKDINRNAANYAITRTIVELTHELGMCSIAEWAETPDTIASLIELNVDYGQGFGLARPMAPDLVTQAMSSGALVRDPTVIALLQNGRPGARATAAARTRHG